jgi:hypothetical protein
MKAAQVNNSEQPTDAKPEARSLGSTQKALLSIFLSIYVCSIWLMACPHQWSIARQAVSPMKWVLVYCGTWFDPRLFAPDPPLLLERYDSDITMSDGSTVHWSYPEEGKFVWGKRLYARLLLMYIRYAKSDKKLYKGLARYLAHEHQSTSRSPVTVEIVHYSSPIAPPGSVPMVPEPEVRHVVYTYTVSAEDLR